MNPSATFLFNVIQRLAGSNMETMACREHEQGLDAFLSKQIKERAPRRESARAAKEGKGIRQRQGVFGNIATHLLPHIPVPGVAHLVAQYTVDYCNCGLPCTVTLVPTQTDWQCFCGHANVMTSSRMCSLKCRDHGFEELGRLSPSEVFACWQDECTHCGGRGYPCQEHTVLELL